MTMTLNIPDDLLGELSAKFHDVGLTALEALAARAYAEEVLSLEQIRRRKWVFFPVVSATEFI